MCPKTMDSFPSLNLFLFDLVMFFNLNFYFIRPLGLETSLLQPHFLSLLTFFLPTRHRYDINHGYSNSPVFPGA